jgi:hypothetical protein
MRWDENPTMQRCYLGDALDFWKSTALDWLRRSRRGSSSLKVLPMFSDAGWREKELALYAELLGADRRHLLSTERVPERTRDRVTYFGPFVGRNMGDVFVDPDSGVSPSAPSARHISPKEVAALSTGDNVVAIYQHRPRGEAASGWLNRYRRLLATADARVIGYESAQVGMLFTTQSPRRHRDLRSYLASRLGVVARARGNLSARLII